MLKIGSPKHEKYLERFRNMQSFELQLKAQGVKLIAGLDEAGRGPMAGPVVAAAVILPEDFSEIEVNDSKKLSASLRNKLCEIIEYQSIAVGVGIVDAPKIDEINIFQATLLAMSEALDQVSSHSLPEHLLIDALTLPNTKISQSKIIRGDSLSISIAAASIVAKNKRDEIMIRMSQKYPEYEFENHKGYCTKRHIELLELLGPSPIHRHSFAPVKRVVRNKDKKQKTDSNRKAW